MAIAVSTVDDGEEEVGKSGCVPSAAVSFPLLGEEDMKAWKAGTVPPSVPKNQFKFVNDTIRRTAAEMVAEKPAARCARVRIDRMKVMSETPEFILLIMGFTVTVE